MTQIEYKGQVIDCYGDMYPEQNVLITGECSDGWELEEIHADGFPTWDAAVAYLVNALAVSGCTVQELQAV